MVKMACSVPRDLKEFSSCQIALINEVLEDLDIAGSISVQKIGKSGDNYTSEIKVLKVNKNNEEIFKAIVKIAPKVPGDDNPFSSGLNIFFNNEITMYTEVLETMQELQIDAKIEAKDTIRYAKCYAAIRDTPDEIILLQDLSRDNYVLMDKFQPLSHAAMQIVLKNLAVYHSLSYVLKAKSPEEFSNFCEDLIDLNSFEVNEGSEQSLQAFGNKFSEVFVDEKHKNIIKESFRCHFTNTFELAEADKDSDQSVIIHGDCWTNNILFQLKDDVPTNCVLIDYQLARESLPVADILYLVFSCTDYKSRSLYYYIWIDFYYTQLKESLAIFGLQIDRIYSRDKFDADLRRYSKAYLSTAMISASVLLRETRESAIIKDALMEVNNVKDFLDLINVNDLNNETLSKIRNRIEGLIDSCIDFGYIEVT